MRNIFFLFRFGSFVNRLEQRNIGADFRSTDRCELAGTTETKRNDRHIGPSPNATSLSSSDGALVGKSTEKHQPRIIRNRSDDQRLGSVRSLCRPGIGKLLHAEHFRQTSDLSFTGTNTESCHSLQSTRPVSKSPSFRRRPRFRSRVCSPASFE